MRARPAHSNTAPGVIAPQGTLPPTDLKLVPTPLTHSLRVGPDGVLEIQLTTKGELPEFGEETSISALRKLAEFQQDALSMETKFALLSNAGRIRDSQQSTDTAGQSSKGPQPDVYEQLSRLFLMLLEGCEFSQCGSRVRVTICAERGGKEVKVLSDLTTPSTWLLRIDAHCAEIRARYCAELAARGLHAKVAQVIRELQETGVQARTVSQLWEQGIALQEIAKHTGLVLSTVKKWLMGGIPLEIQRRLASSRAKRAVAIEIPRAESLPLARVFGYHLARGTPGVSLKSDFRVSLSDRDRANQFAKDLSVITGKECVAKESFSEKKSIWTVCVASSNLCLLLNTATDNCQRVPFEYLVTREERTDALRVLFALRGGVASEETSVELRSNSASPLIEDAILLLNIIGVPASLRREGKVLAISGREALTRFHTKIGFVDQAEHERLTKTIASFTKREYSIEEYLAVLGHRKAHPRATVAALSGQFGVKAQTIQTWLTYESMPGNARQYYDQARLRLRRPDPEVVGHCFREAGLSRQVSRALAEVLVPFLARSIDEALTGQDSPRAEIWSQIDAVLSKRLKEDPSTSRLFSSTPIARKVLGIWYPASEKLNCGEYLETQLQRVVDMDPTVDRALWRAAILKLMDTERRRDYFNYIESERLMLSF